MARRRSQGRARHALQASIGRRGSGDRSLAARARSSFPRLAKWQRRLSGGNCAPLRRPLIRRSYLRRFFVCMNPVDVLASTWDLPKASTRGSIGRVMVGSIHSQGTEGGRSGRRGVSPATLTTHGAKCGARKSASKIEGDEPRGCVKHGVHKCSLIYLGPLSSPRDRHRPILQQVRAQCQIPSTPAVRGSNVPRRSGHAR